MIDHIDANGVCTASLTIPISSVHSANVLDRSFTWLLTL